jgi:hypothetical protein
MSNLRTASDHRIQTLSIWRVAVNTRIASLRPFAGWLAGSIWRLWLRMHACRALSAEWLALRARGYT